MADNNRRNKRARLVCVLCHDKKVKCDLQSKIGQDSRCTNCAVVGDHCRLRPSKRGKHRRSLDESSNTRPLGRTINGQDSADHQHDSVLSHTQSNFSSSSNVQARDFDRQPQNAYATEPENAVEGQNSAAQSYLGETGFLQLFSQERVTDTANMSVSQTQAKDRCFDLPSHALQESFAETFFEYCYPWCPVIERDDLRNDLGRAQSPLLTNALALVASQIQPPVIKHATSSVYYDRAKRLFYGSDEKGPITCIKAMTLFYWWNPIAPTTVNMDSAWWWTGVAIRLAQQIGMHREPKPEPGQEMTGSARQGLRRRIWWTLFARERLTGICQGRPCIIDPEDCNIREPSLDDFPEPRDGRAETFIYWVRLCGIIGRVGKYLSRSTGSSPFPVHLATELIAWVQSLPEHLKLPIATDCTTTFNRDVHQLHLPYLTTISILHLSRSSRPLPKAYTAAVLAASCVARIFEDYLARGSIRFLSAITSWYVAVAILALIHGRQVEHLTKTANDDIRILQIALKELGSMWPSARMFERGLNRFLGGDARPAGDGEEMVNTLDSRPSTTSPGLEDLCMSNGVDWMQYFPFATMQTSALASILLANNQEEPFPGLDWPSDFSLQLQDLFDPTESFSNIPFI